MRHQTPLLLLPKGALLFSLSLIGTLWGSGLAHAKAEYSIQMHLGKQRVRVNEEVKLEIHLAASLRRDRFRTTFYKNFTPPSLSNFTVLDRSESTQRSINIVGRQYRQTYTHVITYLLRPTKEGTFTLSPATAIFNGRKLRSKGLLLTVLPPRKAPPPLLEGQAPDRQFAGDAFIQVYVDRKNAYVGQPVVVSWYSYTQSRHTVTPTSPLPDAPGFFNKSLLKKMTMERVDVGGEVYVRYLLYRRIYWPQRSGNLTIGPRTVSMTTRNNIFTGKTLVRSSAPVQLKILPLPRKGRPANFHEDNVGRFVLKSDLKPTTLKTNEAIDVTFTIRGEGLISALKLGALPKIDWARVEPNGMPTQTEKIQENRRVLGETRHKYILIPTKAGRHRFPKVVFNYFDPTTRRYVSASTKPVDFTVLLSKTPPPSRPTRQPATTGRENILAPKIKPPHVKPITGSSVRAQLMSGWLFWLLLLLPPLLWLAVGGLLFLHRKRTQDLMGRKRRALHHKRKSAMRSALQYKKAGDTAQFYGELSKIILDALGFRLGRSALGLTGEELQEILGSTGCPPQVISRLLDALESFDFAQYAPTVSSDPHRLDEALAQTKTLLSQIDKIPVAEVEQ